MERLQQSLIHAGHTSTGLGRENYQWLHARLARLERKILPFAAGHRTGRMTQDTADIIEALNALEEQGGEGTVTVPGGATLRLTHLDKRYFPAGSITKGALLRYYVRAAAVLLPVIADRPLVLHRFPSGVDGESFYQQKAPDDAPDAVRTATVAVEGRARERRVVGGDLATLLWSVQNGVISVHPWHSRVKSLNAADYAILDLDPGPRAPFRRVVEVARCIQDVLGEVRLHGGVKTSGASGLHVYLPLPARTSYETATLVAQSIATRVVEVLPGGATLTRALKARPPAAVYVDCLQNVRGKTVAAAWAVRAKAGAPVSTPLEWSELDARLDPRDFTRDVVLERIAKRGDLWAKALARPNSLAALARTRRTRNP